MFVDFLRKLFSDLKYAKLETVTMPVQSFLEGVPDLFDLFVSNFVFHVSTIRYVCES